MVDSVTDGDFKTAVLGEAVLVDFWAEWCAPCKQLSPFIEQLAAEKPELKVLKMDIDSSPQTPSELGISSIPTIILFKDGKEIDRRSGLLPYAELRAWAEAALGD